MNKILHQVARLLAVRIVAGSALRAKRQRPPAQTYCLRCAPNRCVDPVYGEGCP